MSSHNFGTTSNFTEDPYTTSGYTGALTLWWDGRYQGLGWLIRDKYLPPKKPDGTGPDIIYCPTAKKALFALGYPIPQMHHTYSYVGGLKHSPGYTADLGDRARLARITPRLALCLSGGSLILEGLMFSTLAVMSSGEYLNSQIGQTG